MNLLTIVEIFQINDFSDIVIYSVLFLIFSGWMTYFSIVATQSTANATVANIQYVNTISMVSVFISICFCFLFYFITKYPQKFGMFKFITKPNIFKFLGFIYFINGVISLISAFNSNKNEISTAHLWNTLGAILNGLLFGLVILFIALNGLLIMTPEGRALLQAEQTADVFLKA
jgi:hypothetical protein